jgi:hypothetical protein
MTRWRWAVVALSSGVGVAVLFLVLPGIALADNCSSLSDCWGTAAGAASAAAGAAGGVIGGLLGGGGNGEGGGGGGDGDDDGLPENEDLPDPRPC